MTHGHELKGENAGSRLYTGQRGIKGRKWDKHNSIINKIDLKMKKAPTSLCSKIIFLIFYLFLERGGRREKERERNIDV